MISVWFDVTMLIAYKSLSMTPKKSTHKYIILYQFQKYKSNAIWGVDYVQCNLSEGSHPALVYDKNPFNL